MSSKIMDYNAQVTSVWDRVALNTTLGIMNDEDSRKDKAMTILVIKYGVHLLLRLGSTTIWKRILSGRTCYNWCKLERPVILVSFFLGPMSSNIVQGNSKNIKITRILLSYDYNVPEMEWLHSLPPSLLDPWRCGSLLSCFPSLNFCTPINTISHKLLEVLILVRETQ